MTQRANNHEEIKKRGGVHCGNDDFEIVKCTICKCQYLYNNETLEIYTNPDDLSERFINTEGIKIPPCRNCSNESWDFEEIQSSQIHHVEKGPWSWCR